MTRSGAKETADRASSRSQTEQRNPAGGSRGAQAGSESERTPEKTKTKTRGGVTINTGEEDAQRAFRLFASSFLEKGSFPDECSTSVVCGGPRAPARASAARASARRLVPVDLSFSRGGEP